MKFTKLSIQSPPIFSPGTLEEFIQADPPTSADDLFHLVVSTDCYTSIPDVKLLGVSISLVYTGSNFAIPEQPIWLHADLRLPVQIETQSFCIKPNSTATIFLNPKQEGVGGVYASFEKENKAYNSVLYTRSNILVYLNRRVDLL